MKNLIVLEKQLVSRMRARDLVRFVWQYVAARGGHIALLELMAGLNLWLEDTLRIARYLVDGGMAKAAGGKLILKKGMQGECGKVLRRWQWLLKWDHDYMKKLPLSAADRALMAKFNRLVKGRPSNNDKIDQYYNLPETNVARLRYVAREPMISQKSVCFLGDDDLTSLVFALSGRFAQIVVYDIDKRIVNFINQLSRKLGLNNYRAVRHDYRRPFQDNWRFDIFHSDPPATIEAIDLVLKVARAKAEPQASFYLSWPEFICDPRYLTDLQKAYAKNGWLVTAKLPEFNQYDNACFFNYITAKDWRTLKMFNLNKKDILAAPALQRYCLTRLLLSARPKKCVGKWNKEIYLSNLHKIPSK